MEHTNGKIDRQTAIETLTDLRQQWENNAQEDGETFAEVQGSVGWLLVDVAGGLGLNAEEEQQVLGDNPVFLE